MTVTYQIPAAPINRGDIGRIVMAHGACCQILAGDSRVLDFYRHWVSDADGHRAAGAPAHITTIEDLDRVMADIQQAEINELATILNTISVPWRWAAEAMIASYFPTMRWNDRHPNERPRAVTIWAELQRYLPKGRLARHLGRDVSQWVEWWYRLDVKHEPLHVLVEEYATRENRVTEAHSVVRNGAARARILLNRSIPR